MTNPSFIEDLDLKAIFKNALMLAIPSHAVNRVSQHTTTKRTLTKRGVIWLGQTCNLRCQFCYFINRIDSEKHPEHAFMPLKKAEKICKTLKDFYGNTAVDIQGGEPTIYKDIYRLTAYCRDIGLRPTLITNALKLENPETCRQYKASGIGDFLVSIHGIGSVYDKLVSRKGANERQMKALRNLQELEIPFRFNCVLSKPVIEQLPLIAELASKTGALVVNFIAFNPFEDQSQKGRRSTLNVPRYSEVKEKLTEALDILDKAGIETNVRYFPICMLEERHRKNTYNFQQLPYDHHEWDYASWAWTGLQPQRISEGETSDPINPSASKLLVHVKKPFKRLANIPAMRRLLYKAHSSIQQRANRNTSKEELYRKIAKIHSEIHCKYVFGKGCNLCSAKAICDGFHGDYACIFGTEEVQPVQSSKKIDDPCFYIKEQKKIETNNNE